MEITEIISAITSLLTLIGIVFAAFLYFKNPQERLDKKQALNEANDKNKTPIVNFEVLKSNFDMMCKINGETFAKLELQIKEAFTIANNHTNETDANVKALVVEVGALRNETIELKTIINERIPKKV